MNPFISFCLYVAARVFVQYLKSRPKDEQVRSSLQFLLSAMHAIKRKNPLTESFIVQLDVDLEGAGLEDSNSLRANLPRFGATEATRSSGCPIAEWLEMEPIKEKRHPTYGDTGLAAFTEPNRAAMPVVSGPQKPDTFMAANMEFNNDTGSYQLPNRQRTPGSMQGSQSGSYQSPQSFNPEMDTSPDGSGSGDHRSPNSLSQSLHNLSSHTSNTAHSPQNKQRSDPSLTNGIMRPFDVSDLSTFTTDFEMHSFPGSSAEQQQSGFVMPQDWNMGSTGLTPGPTGLTPGASGLGDMMGMTEADWLQMMETFSTEGMGVHAGVPHDTSVQEMILNSQGRRS